MTIRKKLFDPMLDANTRYSNKDNATVIRHIVDMCFGEDS